LTRVLTFFLHSCMHVLGNDGTTRALTYRRIKLLPDLSDLNGIVVVLVRPRNPLNIGAAARALSNFGAHCLRVVNPYAVAFREARSAVGASELLKKAEEFTSVADAVSDCVLVVGTTAARNRTLHHPLRRLDARSAGAIHRQLRSGRVAILFGSEKIGLTNEDFSHCHWLLNIPTSETNVSMNLGQAVAVCLYELARKTGKSGSAKAEKKLFDRATAGTNEQIGEALLEALRHSGYVKPGTDALCDKKVRSLLLRFNLDTMDAKVLLGMVRQIVWRMRQPAPQD
jgi:TrmH family RNA methyltransferase